MAAYCMATMKRARGNESRSVLRMTQQMHKTCTCNTQLHSTVGVLREITTTTTLLSIRSANNPKVKNRCVLCFLLLFFDRLGVGQNIPLCASFAASNTTAVAEIEVPLCIEPQAGKGLTMCVCVCVCMCVCVCVCLSVCQLQ